LAEYRLTPFQKKCPAPSDLLRKLHERGFLVEVRLDGLADNWGALRFYEEGPSELECFLIRDEETRDLTASIPQDSSPRSKELLLRLIDMLLKDLGGSIEEAATQEHWTAEEFLEQNCHLSKSARPVKDWAWLLFSWILTVAAVAAYFNVPSNLHLLALTVIVFTGVSAVGLSFSSAKG
jgi:hypothetical protein